MRDEDTVPVAAFEGWRRGEEQAVRAVFDSERRVRSNTGITDAAARSL